jgi:hypothetical protein
VEREGAEERIGGRSVAAVPGRWYLCFDSGRSVMAGDDAPERDEQHGDPVAPNSLDSLNRPALRKPGAADGERALGLQVAKLFGISPRLLMTPASAPADRSAEDGLAPALEGEHPEPQQQASHRASPPG